MTANTQTEKTTETEIILVGSAISAAAAVFFLTLPLAIGSAANEAEYGEGALGALATTYLIAFTAFGAVTAAAPNVLRLRLMTAAAFAALVAGFVVSSAVLSNYPLLVSGFLLAGVGAGALYSISFRIIGAARNIERAFGWKLFTEQTVAALVFFYLSSRIETFQGQFIVLALVSIAIALSIFFIPNIANAESEIASEESSTPGALLALSIAAVILFMFAMTGPWAFLEQLRIDRNLGNSSFARLGAISLMLGAGGGLAAAFQGNRFGVRIPLVFSALLTALIFVAAFPNSTTTLSIFILAFPFVWNYALAFQLAAAANNDSENKFTAWLSPAIALGASAGPIVTGLILENTSGFSVMLGFSLIVAFAALLASAKSVVLRRHIFF